MDRKYIRENIDPFKLFGTLSTIPSSSKEIANITNSNQIKSNIIKPNMSLKFPSSSSSTKPLISNNSISNNTASTNIIDTTFASRYEDEIAPASKINEYKAIGTKHKNSLMKEAYQMQNKFNNDILEAKQVEATVQGISQMLNEFTNILRSQSGYVDELYETAIDATDFVKQADDELQLTIKRSTSHSRNISMLAIGLALLLLLLDFLTP